MVSVSPGLTTQRGRFEAGIGHIAIADSPCESVTVRKSIVTLSTPPWLSSSGGAETTEPAVKARANLVCRIRTGLPDRR